MLFDPAEVLRQARLKAGLSQRDLAARAGTAQSVVARIELADTSPTWTTLGRLLTAAGFELDAWLELKPVADSHMLADVARVRRLTPEQRLDEVAAVQRFVANARRV